jgi:hypothetical protein
VATFSTVLGLKLNQDSDPFLLSDFIANWDILDASPGTFICTSTSLPNWGSGQKGRLVFQTDTKQLAYWTGSAWKDMVNTAPSFAGGATIGTAMNPGSTPNFNVVTFTTPRASSLAVIMTGAYQCPNNKSQDGWQTITFDGVSQQMGSFLDPIRFVGNSLDSAATAGCTVTSVAVIPSVSSGQHKLGIQPVISSHYSTAITMIGARVIGLVASFSGGNSL